MSEYLAATDVLKVAPAGAAPVALSYVGTPWANSAWVEIAAAIGGAAGAVLKVIDYRPAGNISSERNQEIDIGVGAAGAEAVIATLKYNHPHAVTYFTRTDNVLPIGVDAIPAGSRVAARFRCSGSITAGYAPTAKIGYVEKPLIGNILTTTQPLKVAPAGATAVSLVSAADWSDSAWVEVVAATAAGWALADVRPQSKNAYSGGDYVVEVGMGAAGAEAVVLAVKASRLINSGGCAHALLGLPCPDTSIPAGARVAVRARGDLDPTESNVTVWLSYHELPL